MEFRQLRYFLAVAEHLHFTLAAERLGIAQPPLSQQIMKLEREIGTRLFIRYPRRVELTEAGMIFRERAQRVLDEANDALEQVKMAARGESGHLSIGFAGSTVFHPRVAAVLRAFRESYPAVKMRTEESNSVALLDKLADGGVDCAMIRLPLASPAMRVTTLVEERMIAVLPAGHALEREADVEIRQLSGDPFILFPRPIGPELYDSIIAACHADGFSPRIALESPQISSCVNMAAAGFGVAIIPESIGQVRAEGVSFKPIRNQGLRTAIALVCRMREKSVTVRNFAEMVRRQGAAPR